jgi:flagellin
MPVIANNIAANQALAYLNKNSAAESSALAQISSGSRITSAASDASGLAISTNMNSDVTVLQQAATNTNIGIAALNTADGGMSNISDILTRMKSLATQAQSATSSTDSLSDINTEFTALAAEVTSIVGATTFNGTSLLDGSVVGGFANGTGVAIQTGVAASDTTAVKTPDAATAVATAIGDTITDAATAATAFGDVSTALTAISTGRASIGAQLESLQYTATNISTSVTNLQSSASAITDVDLSQAQTQYTNQQTLTSAAVSALTEANQMQSELLKVLQ